MLAVRFSERMVSEVVQTFWAALQRGEFVSDAAAEAGTYRKKGTRYFPKGTDLSLHSAADLDWVATELNDRPRKRLGFAKPIEEIGPLLLR